MSDTIGCPSGLAPAHEPTVSAADPRAFVRQEKGESVLELSVSGARCAGCLSKIEGALTKLDGVSNARLNLSTGKLHVAWRGELDPRTVAQTVSDLGYKAAPFEPENSDAEGDAYGRHLIKALAVAGFATANIMLLSVGVWASGGGEMGEATRGLMHLISALIAIPAVAYSGQPFFRSAWQTLRAGHANMDVPISLAVLLATGVSLFEALNGGEHAYFDAAVMLLFFLLIGRWLDHALRRKARSAAEDLIALQTVTATRLDSAGHPTSVAAKDLRVGDTLLIAPGDRIPVDGSIASGRSSVDASLITGETEPVACHEGAELRAGTINLTHTLTMQATATVQNSLVSELAELIEAGQQSKGHFVRLADQASRLYVPTVHTLAALTLVGWLVLAQAPFRESLMAAIALLIITCPCALGLATPVVQVVATSKLFRRGILVTSGDALERLAKVDHVVFDKTGTLTTGQYRWTNPRTLPEAEQKALAALARGSRHPVARAVVEVCGTGTIAEGIEEIPGQGCSGTVDGVRIALGRAEFVGAEAQEHAEEGQSAAWVKVGDGAAHRLTFEDDLRPGAREAVDALRALGLAVSIQSGDRAAAVCAVADKLGIDDWYAEQTPEDKAERLKALREAGHHTAMVGDGLNDTPALAFADASLTPATAAEAAQTSADFVFRPDNLRSVAITVEGARSAKRHILQNFAFAALYNVIAAPVAMAGLVTPLIAALAMSGSSMLVTLNALRQHVGSTEEEQPG